MLRCLYFQRRWAHRRGGFVTGGGWSSPSPAAKVGKSEWWAVDGEMHEIGEGVPHRERFAIPRDNLPNRRRKQMREQFMRRTRLVLKDSEHETWCKNYMELYQELRENWERLYWDEGYSKKIAQDHANYDSAEDDDLDFSPYRRRHSYAEPNKDLGFGMNKQDQTWERVTQIRDKFEYDRERRIRERAFAPMNTAMDFGPHDSKLRNQRDPSFTPMNMESNFGSHDSNFRNQSVSRTGDDSIFRDQHDSHFRNDSSFRSQRHSNTGNDSNFRNQHDSNSRHASSFRDQHDSNFRHASSVRKPFDGRKF